MVTRCTARIGLCERYMSIMSLKRATREITVAHVTRLKDVAGKASSVYLLANETLQMYRPSKRKRSRVPRETGSPESSY
jgi:hypothetical protein